MTIFYLKKKKKFHLFLYLDVDWLAIVDQKRETRARLMIRVLADKPRFGGCGLVPARKTKRQEKKRNHGNSVLSSRSGKGRMRRGQRLLSFTDTTFKASCSHEGSILLRTTARTTL